ncbi:DUF2752 domain-containing protein [Acrocarpospora catenulata]|uniref:DUF2752 domain-containing protein n=1 Tax=Acrocarpospora catenulata TaxID=2836182 RepID=UPI001BD99ABC|nr:DUF2752 domain-containing protein [Acrocarpospora catenulata]
MEAGPGVKGRRLRGLVAPGGVAGIGLAAWAYVSAVDPNSPGRYPTCPLFAVTGLYCPGCGSLRAVYALSHGDVGAALGLNPLFVVMLPVLVYVWGIWVVGVWRGKGVRSVLMHPVVVWGSVGVVMAYWIVRNLPFGRFLAP